MNLEVAFNVVAAALRKDTQYYIAWKANIAMAFVDTFRQQGCRDSYKKLHKVANDAAVYFLDLLVRESKTKPRPQEKRSRQSHRTTRKGAQKIIPEVGGYSVLKNGR
jgi:hypothetical protein